MSQLEHRTIDSEKAPLMHREPDETVEPAKRSTCRISPSKFFIHVFHKHNLFSFNCGFGSTLEEAFENMVSRSGFGYKRGTVLTIKCDGDKNMHHFFNLETYEVAKINVEFDTVLNQYALFRKSLQSFGTRAFEEWYTAHFPEHCIGVAFEFKLKPEGSQSQSFLRLTTNFIEGEKVRFHVLLNNRPRKSVNRKTKRTTHERVDDTDEEDPEVNQDHLQVITGRGVIQYLNKQGLLLETQLFSSLEDFVTIKRPNPGRNKQVDLRVIIVDSNHQVYQSRMCGVFKQSTAMNKRNELALDKRWKWELSTDGA